MSVSAHRNDIARRIAGLRNDPHAGQQNRLADALHRAKVDAYKQRISQEARAAGHRVYGELDAETSAAIRADADDAARSIVHTFAERRRHAAGAGDALRPFRARYARMKSEQVVNLEMTASSEQAARDFYRHNAIITYGRVTPQATDSDDACLDAINQGWLPFAQIEWDMPAHPNCIHATEYMIQRVLMAGEPDVTWAAGMRIRGGST